MGIFTRGSKLWITFKDAAGKWRNASTGHAVGEESLAQAKLEAVLAAVTAQQPATSPAAPGLKGSVREYAAIWIPQRRERDLDWKNDEGRLKHHVLPVIGDQALAEIRTRHIVDLFHRIRTTPLKTTGTLPAPRHIYNIYSVVSAMFRDAQLANRIETSPCVLDERQLGPLVDGDPEWRADSVFTRDEARAMISDERLPLDRRIYYAFGLLAGLRPGEIAALRMRHYEPDVQPLGRLTVAASFSTPKNKVKSTKTNAVRRIPVHPTLAALLAEWLLSGWATMCDRRPEPDDLLLPLPPADARARRKRNGEPVRTGDYAARRWRDDDQSVLGWRDREMYATKSTFITLAIEDGARPEIIRDRVTHTKSRRDAFSGYDRGPHWIETCSEISKLQITRLPVAVAAAVGAPYSLLTAGTTDDNQSGFRAGEGIRTPGFIANPSTESADPTVVRTSALRVMSDPSGPAHADRPNVRSEVAAIAAELEALRRRLLALAATLDD